jgi:hypothetical protein
MPSIAYLFWLFFVLYWLSSFCSYCTISPTFFWCVFWKEDQKWCYNGNYPWLLACFYTLLIPFAIGVTIQLVFSFRDHGNCITKAFSTFGLNYLDPIPHAFLGMLLNFLSYAAVSVSFKGNYRERNYAEMFVDIDKYITNHENAFIWKGTAYISDIQKVLLRFLGEDRTKRALTILI